MKIKEYIEKLNKKELDSLMYMIDKRYSELKKEEGKIIEDVRYTKTYLVNFILEKQSEYQINELYKLSRYELYTLAQKYGLK